MRHARQNKSRLVLVVVVLALALAPFIGLLIAAMR